MKKVVLLLILPLLLTGCKKKEVQPQVIVTIIEEPQGKQYIGEAEAIEPKEEKKEVPVSSEVKAFEDVIFEISTDLD